MAKKNNNKKLLLVGAAAIFGYMMYKKKQAANEEFILPNKKAANLQPGKINLKQAFTAKPIKTMVTRRGQDLERIGNFENIQ